METTLLNFVFDIATALIALVAENFGEYPLEGVVADGSRDGMVTVVTDVNRGTEEMA